MVWRRWKKFEDMFSHFSTIPACDRQTCDSIVHAMHSITRNPEIPDKITTVVFTLAV